MVTSRLHLTERYIDAAVYEGANNSRDVRWDDDPVGFGVRLYPSGRKAYVVLYRNTNGVKRLMALGDRDLTSLDAVRKLAKRALFTVDDQKADPLVDRRKQRLEGRTGTVEPMFKAYVEARAKAPSRPMKRPDSALWYGTKFIFPKFSARPWRDVKRSEVRDWHARIKSANNANNALRALRSAFYWRLWQEDDSAGHRSRESDTRNPCAGIPMRPTTGARQVRLELHQLPALEKAIDDKVADPYLRAFFRFLLATGCRRGEALKLQWRDLNLPDNGIDATVTFRDTKAGDDHKVPLTPQAAALLQGLPQVRGNPYVFIGHRKGTGLQSVAKAWQRARKAAGLPHLRIHDLRRSFGSWLGDAGFTSKQIGATLGHKTDITSRVYMALGDETKRAAVDAVQVLMDGAGKPKGKRGKVVKLPRQQRA